MTLPASIEAGDYSRWDPSRWDPSRWDDDEFVADAGETGTVVDAPALASDGGGASESGPITVLAGSEADGGRLDKWLAARLPAYSRSRIQRWIADGHVRIGDRVLAIRDPVWSGDHVVVAPQSSDADNAFLPEDVPLAIRFEDDTLIVLDKRPGLVVHPASGNWSGTVLNGLLHHEPALAAVPRAGIVHRLDKDTSGLMVVARTVVAQTDLVRQLQARTVGRTYVAIVHGTPPPHGRVAWPIGRDPRDRLRMAAFKPASDDAGPPPGAKPAATRFATLASRPVGGTSVSLVVCRLETGRTHQIRVHLQALGHPLVGDATYGGARGVVPFGRQALHAWRLRLVHPRTGAAMAWQADLPDDLAGLAATCGFDAAASLDAWRADDGDD